MHQIRSRLSDTFRGIVISYRKEMYCRIKSKSIAARLAQDICNSIFEHHCECEGVYAGWISNKRMKDRKSVV